MPTPRSRVLASPACAEFWERIAGLRAATFQMTEAEARSAMLVRAIEITDQELKALDQAENSSAN